MNQRKESAPRVAIVGATGAVGQEFLKVLAERDFPIGELRLLASARSAGKSFDFASKSYAVEELTEESFAGVDLALFSAGGGISRKFAPVASDAGATVVDNSSAFRMQDNVPLVIPEVNPEALQGIVLGQGGIVANPNCSTIILLVPVTPLHRMAQVRRMVVSTYQAASGAGAEAMAELENQSRDVLAGKEAQPRVFSEPCAFNVFSHNSELQADGYNLEEVKMVKETHKIWGAAIPVTATCIRVPVLRAHSESINLEFEQPLDEKEALEVLRQAPGVIVLDDREGNHFPTPLQAAGRDGIFVGRVRNDPSQAERSGGGLDLFVCGDQLRKGAALNAVQIAELLI